MVVFEYGSSSTKTGNLMTGTDDNKINIKLLDVETINDVSVDQLEIATQKVCFEHWNILRADRIAPDYKEIDLLTFPLKAIPSSSIVDIPPDGQNIKYRYWGSSLTRLTNKDMTGKNVEDMSDKEDGMALLKQYELVISTKKPALFIMNLASQFGQEATETVLRLPLSSDGETINHVLSFNNLGNNPFLYADNIYHTLIE
ncbi:MAG: PAS domain-containing protein [Rhodospirillales bacterium]|jgi:hypothetical protein|nr:PAS domain-containing protein [Rhodospirillales bacterium]